MMKLKRPRDHEYKGHVYSLDDRCLHCHRDLGHHSGGDDNAYCPLPGRHYPNIWNRESEFLLWPESIALPEGL